MKPSEPKRRSTQSAYLALRDRILQAKREELHLHPTSSSTEPWGVVMDWGMSKANLSVVASVVALSDGHASIYLSTGGGNIGGGEEDDSIRNAAQQAVILAASVHPLMRSTETFSLPKPDEVTFHFLTDAGVFSSTVMANDIVQGHPLSKLGGAMQQIIGRYRLTKKTE
jgi:hypothetical protein